MSLYGITKHMKIYIYICEDICIYIYEDIYIYICIHNISTNIHACMFVICKSTCIDICLFHFFVLFLAPLKLEQLYPSSTTANDQYLKWDCVC